MSNSKQQKEEESTTRNQEEAVPAQEREYVSRDDLGATGIPHRDRLLSENEIPQHGWAVPGTSAQTEESIESTQERRLPTPITDLNSIDGNTRIPNELKTVFEIAIRSAYPGLHDPPVLITQCEKDCRFGDYKCHAATSIADVLKTFTTPIPPSPRDVANNILANIPANILIEKIEIEGVGTLNIYLSKPFIAKVLKSILRQGSIKPPQTEKQRVVVDFSAPKIMKDMHIGHLRSTVIGDSICRILEFLNHDVLRINHLCDWGIQFGMIIAHMEDKCPDYKTETPTISKLQEFYKESKKRFNEDEAFKERAYVIFTELQSGQPDYVAAWKMICNISYQEFQRIYHRLDIRILVRGASYYQSRMESIVEELKDKGLLEEDEGRLLMWGNSETGDEKPLTLLESDGEFTYDTSDMAAIKQRVEELKADRIIYVRDSSQYNHFMTIKQCAIRAGIIKPELIMVQHIGFGVVLGEDTKKLKNKTGGTVTLNSLLDESIKIVIKKLLSKGKHHGLTPAEFTETQNALAYGCIKYADLRHHRINEYIFSFNDMLDDNGNTAVYLLHSLSHIKSFTKKANVTRNTVIVDVEQSGLPLNQESEWQLAKLLLRFPEVILKVAEDLYLHNLCEYVYEISTTFSDFYENCYTFETVGNGKILVTCAQLAMCEVTAIILEKCLNLLGLKTAFKM